MSRAAPADVRHAHRVLLHGVTGSGKSTAAEALGAALDLPVHFADEEIGWLPADEAPWTGRPADDQRRIADEITAAPRWVLDSTYGAFRDVVFERTDVIIGLDYSRTLTLARLLRRTAARAIDGRAICNGNRETVRQAFSSDSIIVWHFTSFTKKRRAMRAWADDPQAPPTLLVRRPEELERLFEVLRG